MTVFIVLVNGKISEVFDSLASAQHHAKQANRKWSITDIIEKEIKSL